MQALMKRGMRTMDNIIHFDRQEILRTLDILFNGEMVEIRQMDGKRISSGYFKDYNRLIDQIERFSNKTLYVTLNTPSEGCYARPQHEQMITSSYDRPVIATADKDIARLKWILIDFDPKRVSGTSASDDEKQKAFDKRGEVYNYLTEKGFANPIWADSGNGFHLLYRIDADPSEATETVKPFLHALANRFSDDVIDIDETVYNAARITKLYGSWATKGSNTQERPWRMSRLEIVPQNIEATPLEIIKTVTAELNPTQTTKSADTISKTKLDTYTVTDADAFERNCNLVERLLKDNPYLEKTDNEVARIETDNEKQIIFLTHCLFDHTHVGTSAAILIYRNNGAIVYRCLHNSCNDKTWKDARALLDPDHKASRTSVDDDPTDIDDFLKSIGAYHVADLTEEEREPPEFIVDGLIPVGLTFLAGAPKVRKSFMALQMAADITAGSKFLDRFATTKCGVVYFDFEGSKSRSSKRAEAMGITDTPVLIVHGNASNKDDKRKFQITEDADSGLLKTIKTMHNLNPSIRVFIIDTYSRARGRIRTLGANAYDVDVDILEPLQRLAINEKIAIICIHHYKKGGGMAADGFERLNGTMGISGSADCVITLNLDGDRTDGKAIIEYTPRDAIGGELNVLFNPMSCRWGQYTAEERDINGAPIPRFLIDHMPPKAQTGDFYSYDTIYKSAYHCAVEEPSKTVQSVIAEWRDELYLKHGIAVQVGVRYDGKRGIRATNCKV